MLIMIRRLHILCLLFVFVTTIGFSQNETTLNSSSLTAITWNIQDLGRTKDSDEILFIAETLRFYDVIAIQEVVAKDPAGAQSVAKIADELNRMGSKWEYRVSNPTQSPSVYMSERYAFLWKTSKVLLLGSPYLDNELKEQCAREPFIAKFKDKQSSKSFYMINFHARKHSDYPEEEIYHLQNYSERLKSENIILAGDFNLNESHEVWSEFYKKGYYSALKETPTTLKKDCVNGKYLHHSVDNLYYKSPNVKCTKSGVIDLVNDCSSLVKVRGVSDHLPVYMHFVLK